MSEAFDSLKHLKHTCKCKTQDKLKCITKGTTQSKVVAQELSQKFCIQNDGTKEISRIKLDGCFYYPKGSGESVADFLFVVQTPPFSKTTPGHPEDKVIIVELKGSDVEKAFAQIESTVKNILPNLKAFKFKKEAIIVAKRVPKAESGTTKKTKVRLREQLGIIVKTYTSQCDYKL